MTTQVIIKSTNPNHQDILVRSYNPVGGAIIDTKRLTDGEEVSMYLYDGQQIELSEIAKTQGE